MAVTLGQLKLAMRVDGDLLDDRLTRMLSLAGRRVQAEAPNAPIEIQDEAVIQYSALLAEYGGRPFSDAWTASGAASLVKPWRKIRVGKIEAE